MTPAVTSPTNLSDWLAYIESLHPKNIVLELDRVAAVKKAMELELNCPIITVAGTNGKGSTCAMLESILSCAGYRVGCYTSPHLLKFNERIRIGRFPVTDAQLCEAFAAVEKARATISLTYFEFSTLAATWIFKQQKIDIAVLEVGLGGRLDAVNIFEPDVAIITSIGIDHQDYLGDTREKIGFEKAGIFRKGKSAICADPQPPHTIIDYAAAVGADLQLIGRDFSFQVENKTQWKFGGRRGERYGLVYPALRGAYQLLNASACLAALDELKEKLAVSMGNVRLGLSQVTLPGRFQVLPGRPIVILDVAHNPHAAEALAGNLKEMEFRGKTFAVFGMLKDKDITGVIKILKDQVNHWLIANLDVSRGEKAAKLEEILKSEQVSSNIDVFSNVVEAYQQACKLATGNDRIIVFGSFYTVGDILGLIESDKVKTNGVKK